MLGLSEVAQFLLRGVELFRGIANGVLDLANGFLSVAEAFTNGKHCVKQVKFGIFSALRFHRIRKFVNLQTIFYKYIYSVQEGVNTEHTNFMFWRLHEFVKVDAFMVRNYSRILQAVNFPKNNLEL